MITTSPFVLLNPSATHLYYCLQDLVVIHNIVFLVLLFVLERSTLMNSEQAMHRHFRPACHQATVRTAEDPKPCLSTVAYI